MYESDDLGNYAILANSIAPLEKEVEIKKDWVWHMNFDGACCRTECLGTATTDQIGGCHPNPQFLYISCLLAR